MNNISIIFIILGTILIIIFSWWASIKDKRYHGIFRFFSFESIFILIIINAKYWFINPFKVMQIISWIFLLSSIIIASLGFYLLKVIGKPKGKLENTTNIISISLFKYIRHPLYLSLILLGFGALLKQTGFIQLVLLIINIISIIFTAKVEEKEMIGRFGNEYIQYMGKTKMFIPFIWAVPKTRFLKNNHNNES